MSPDCVSPAILKRWLDDGSAVLVDVREPAEHRALRIPGADLMPLSHLDVSRLPPFKKVVVHCQRGARGGAACQRLLWRNPDLEIYNLAGGIEGWRASGLPVEAGDSVLSLDRQVELATGLLLVGATALALLVSPDWALAAGLLGIALCVAGLTGICGMARLLSAMPWNR